MTSFAKVQSFSQERKTSSENSTKQRLGELLLGQHHRSLELPSLERLAMAIISLSYNRRVCETLPLTSSPAELTMVRRGDAVYVSHYETGAVPNVNLLDHHVDLQALVDALGSLNTNLWLEHPTADADYTWLSELSSLVVLHQEQPPPHTTVCQGGAQQTPGKKVSLAYGFRASIAPQLSSVNFASQQANVYSLLFDGQLWAFVRGRRIELCSGPIMVAALQLLQLVREMILPWEEGRPAYQRVRSTSFLSALRLESDRQTTLTLGIETGGSITIPALDFSEVALPTLRLLSDLIRAVLSVDRSQARNLKLVGLRNEVRELRRKVQTHQRVNCIINQDPERLRSLYLAQDASVAESESITANNSRLRFESRWRLELNALESESTYLCGSCLIVASTRGAIAVNRDDGEILWQRREVSNAWMMAGTTLVRLSVDNDIELVSVDDGRTLTYERLARHGLAPVTALLATASVTPPIAILKEGQGHLVGMDLRNGELRWRYPVRPHDNVCLERSGHMLCVVNGDNSLHALDITTGETLWRFQDRARFVLKPILIDDVLIAVSGDLESSQPVLYGIDGLTGYLRWKEPLQGVLSSPPLNFEHTLGICLKREQEHQLLVLDPETGRLLWSKPDPGVASGAAALAIDQTLIVNAPWGSVSSFDLASGATNWSQPLAVNDQTELPPRLNPVLRGGALFVPSSSVHVLRPSDGTLLSGAMACDLIPDFLRVDERGWVYVGEESGLLSAFAPTPHLRLLRGER